MMLLMMVLMMVLLMVVATRERIVEPTGLWGMSKATGRGVRPRDAIVDVAREGGDEGPGGRCEAARCVEGYGQDECAPWVLQWMRLEKVSEGDRRGRGEAVGYVNVGNVDGTG